MRALARRLIISGRAAAREAPSNASGQGFPPSHPDTSRSNLSACVLEFWRAGKITGSPAASVPVGENIHNGRIARRKLQNLFKIRYLCHGEDTSKRHGSQFEKVFLNDIQNFQR
jgi:hypothetical protein